MNIQTAKTYLNSLIGRDLFWGQESKEPTEFHGTSYGGWAVLAESLRADSRVISVGIGEDASFDLSLIAKYGCMVQAFDPTPKSADWVENNIKDARFVHRPKALADYDGVLRLYLPARNDFVSASLKMGGHTSREFVDVPCVKLSTLFGSLGFDAIDVLKIDIEGAEYPVIAESLASGALNAVRQLLVEFHHHMPAFTVADTRAAVFGLRSAGWKIAWRSPSHHELLFIR
jgi:FkbM family methyltransferase